MPPLTQGIKSKFKSASSPRFRQLSPEKQIEVLAKQVEANHDANVKIAETLEGLGKTLRGRR